MTKHDLNQGVDPDFIVIKLDYSRKLILPIHEGFEFLKIFASAQEIKSGFNEEDRLVRNRDDIRISFLTALQLAELTVERTIDPEAE